MKKKKDSPTKRNINKPKPTKIPIKFLVTFLSGLFGVTIFFYLVKGYCPKLIEKASSFTAYVVTLFLNLLGMTARCQAESVQLKGYSFTIIDQCLGAYEVFIFLAGVMAYPVDFRKKLWGIALGIPFLCFINIIRLMFLGVVGTWSPQTSEFMHLYLWQIVIFLTVILACVLWIKLFVRAGEKGF